MKLLSLAMSLVAVEFAIAETADEYLNETTPHHCYQELGALYGSDKGEKRTDIDLLTGLDAQSAQLAAISGCIDNRTQLISGLFTVWGNWNAETNDWDNLQRLETIGKMSGLVQFDDELALSEAGLSGLQEGQGTALQRYWFQEASPDQEQYMLIQKTLAAMESPEWTEPRQKIFNDADIDNDGSLNYHEAQWFLKYVRALDREVIPYNELDYQLERINNHWFIASLTSSPNDAMSFEDYVTVEKMMEALYSADKLTITGFINYWDTKSFDAYKGDKPGEYLTHECQTIAFDGEDRITHVQVKKGAEGVQAVRFQSSKRPEFIFGVDANQVSFEGSDYVRFIEGTDFAGLWGMVAADGNLNGLGLIERNSVCTQAFFDKLGADKYSWRSRVESNFDVPAGYPQEYQAMVEELNENLILWDTSVITIVHPVDETENDQSYATAALLIWIAVVVLILYMVMFFCMARKERINEKEHYMTRE